MGINLEYRRDNFSGYTDIFGLNDRRGEDFFGEEREPESPTERGRVLFRHKHMLPKDWQAQLELSYQCDRNFLEQFFTNDFNAGKEQDTLIYLKKQRDNWAFTSLLQIRINDFDTQTESLPEFAFHTVGKPLLNDLLTLYAEARAGIKRYRPDDESALIGSHTFLRVDIRQEIDWPVHLGPLNVTPYVMNRATYWDEAPIDGEKNRSYNQAGVRANMHFWRIFDVENRMWDINHLRHVVTPEAHAFIGETDVRPGDLYPMDPDIEQQLQRKRGVNFALNQRLQTKRGLPGKEWITDWMRLNISAGFYESAETTMPSGGRFFSYRPEYSLARDHVNAEYFWHISDSTTLLVDTNYDWDLGKFRRINGAIAVQRNPRLRYFLGARWLRDQGSGIGTAGINYKINRKYSISAFQQYDFEYRDGRNLATSISIIRRLSRWYTGLTFTYDEATDDVGLAIAFWPEGIPETRIGLRANSLLGRSDRN